MYKYLGILLIIGLLALGASAVLFTDENDGTEPEQTACQADAKVCPDGTVLGRQGPNCEFPACPEPATTTPTPTVPEDVQEQIDAKSDLIQLDSPAPLTVIKSPLTVAGEARGTWYFEASFSVVLTDWDGRIIAEGVAEAQGDWMTEEFVPFEATLEFESPYEPGAQDFMKRGTLILQKANPSGLPENDDALEIPIRFAE